MYKLDPGGVKSVIHMEEILVANGAGVLVLIVTQLSCMQEKTERHLSDRLFTAMTALTFAALLAETATFYFDGRPGAVVHALQYILNGYLFLAASGVGALWVLYVESRIYHSERRFRRWVIPVVAPYAAIIILILCDLFGAGLVFSITGDNVYHRGKLFILPYLFVMTDYIVSIVVARLAVKKDDHVRFFPVYYFVAPCLIGTVAQNLHYGISTGWLCVALAFQFIQMHLANQSAYEDELSGLFNRSYYNRVMRKLAKSRRKRRIAGIMMDIDGFKSINDRFGHSVGDDAIRALGRILTKVAVEHTMAFRYAGDEFLLLCTDAEEGETERLTKLVEDELERFNESAEKPYRLRLAIGSAVADTTDFDPDVFLYQMDRNMYADKAAHYMTYMTGGV